MLLQNRSRIRHAFQSGNSDHQTFSDSLGEAAILALHFRKSAGFKAERDTAEKLGLVQENLQRVSHRFSFALATRAVISAACLKTSMVESVQQAARMRSEDEFMPPASQDYGGT
jgi:hypothetical protein